MFALPEPSIKFDVPDIVLTLVFVVIKLKKYIFFPEVLYVWLRNQQDIHHLHSSLNSRTLIFR